MTLFWKSLAAILIALILVLTLEKQGKDIALVLTVLVCCMTGVSVFVFLEPVIEFLYTLQSAAHLDSAILKTLLKLVGVGLAGEVVSVICADAGCNALAKGLQLLTSSVLLSLSVPVMDSLMELVREILGGL